VARLGCLCKRRTGLRVSRTLLRTGIDRAKIIERIVAETRALKQNFGTKDDTDVGAMSGQKQLSIVADHVNDAVSAVRTFSLRRRAANLNGPFMNDSSDELDHSMR